MADSDMTLQGGPRTGGVEPVGTRLKRAREAAGLDLAKVSDLTKIPARMLGLIEAGDFAALPARTYATGFTRTYARALGLNEAEYVAAVRAEIGLNGPVDPLPSSTFEPGDPARVPTARLAWLAALGAIAVLVAGWLLWRSYYAPAVSLPSILPDEAATASAAPPEVAPATAWPLPSEAATVVPTAAPAAPAPAARAVRRPPAAPRLRAPAAETVPSAAAPAAVSTGAN